MQLCISWVPAALKHTGGLFSNDAIDFCCCCSNTTSSSRCKRTEGLSFDHGQAMSDIKQHREVKSLPESAFSLIKEDKDRGVQHECK